MTLSREQCPACLGYKLRFLSLCGDCFSKYGKDPEKWPEWLRFLVNDNARLEREDRAIREHEDEFGLI